jgi:hypothetical protein
MIVPDARCFAGVSGWARQFNASDCSRACWFGPERARGFPLPRQPVMACLPQPKTRPTSHKSAGSATPKCHACHARDTSQVGRTRVLSGGLGAPRLPGTCAPPCAHSIRSATSDSPATPEKSPGSRLNWPMICTCSWPEEHRECHAYLARDAHARPPKSTGSASPAAPEICPCSRMEWPENCTPSCARLVRSAGSATPPSPETHPGSRILWPETCEAWHFLRSGKTATVETCPGSRME